MRKDKLYAVLNSIRKNIYNYSDDELMFIQALYISYNFEQDAMVHGLYRDLQHCNSWSINFKLKETDEYKFLDDLRNAINNIDKFDESLFNNLISKKQFLNRLKKAEQRYSTKINHVVQLVFDNMHLNEGLVHQLYMSPKQIYERLHRYDDSEKHKNDVREILKIDREE